MNPMTREWVQKAEDDYTTVRELARIRKPLNDQICFHCQQCAEKYLKALLEELGQFITKTHDLELLLGHLVSTHPGLRKHRRGLAFLSNFAVTVRYPGKRATKRQARATIRWASRVRDACRKELGLRP